VAITLAQAEAYRDDAAAQLAAAAKAASVSSNGRAWASQNLTELRETLGYWQRQVNVMTANNAGASNPTVAIAKWT
jgi:hypothetical protein